MLENGVFNRPYVRDITKICECACSMNCDKNATELRPDRNPDIITNADRIRAMSNIDELIEQLRKSADFEDYPIVASFAAIIEKKYLREAADALEKLQAELEQVKEDWSTAVNGLVLMQKKLNKVYRILYDPLIIVDGGHLRPVKNTSRQQVYKKLVDLQVEMGINRGFPWGEMRMEKKED